MKYLKYSLFATIFVDQNAALPLSGNDYKNSSRMEKDGEHESSGGGIGVERPSSGFGTETVLGISNNTPLRSALKSRFTSLSFSEESPRNEAGTSSASKGSAINNDTPSSENSTGLYTVANITIHQYPLMTSSRNDSALTSFNEDINLWVLDIDQGKPIAATAVHCNLTWTTSAATVSDSPENNRMRCIGEGADSKNQGPHKSSPKYSVTYQQQAESPLSGFDLFVNSSARGPAVWAPRDLSDDASWQINENYFQYPGFVPIGKASPNRKRTATSSSQILNNQIKASGLADSTIASGAVNARRSTPDNTTVQSAVASIINSTLAHAAVNVTSATYNIPNNQIEISEIIESTLAGAALHTDSNKGSNSGLPSDASNIQSKTTDPANNTIIEAAIEAASTLFDIPKDHIKLVSVANNSSTNAAGGPSHFVTADIILNTTVNAAVNAASKVFNIPKSQIKVIGASDNQSRAGAATGTDSASKSHDGQPSVPNVTDSTIAGAAAKALSGITP